MDVNTFYKCKIIEILIEQEPSDNGCVCMSLSLSRFVWVCVCSTQCIDVCAFMRQQQQQPPTINRTNNNNNKKTTIWLKHSSHIHTIFHESNDHIERLNEK